MFTESTYIVLVNLKLYEYKPTRKGQNAVDFLNGYSGYLVCDGYDGYNKLSRVTRCGCWAHARRKFLEAIPKEEEVAETSKAKEDFEQTIVIRYSDQIFSSFLVENFTGLKKVLSKYQI